MTFSVSSHRRHEYDSVADMAAANQEYLQRRAKHERAWQLDLQIFQNTQRILEALNEAMTGPRNPLLNRRFASKARILLGSNARSVTTFTFADGGRAISLDADLLYEVATLIFAMSREAEYGPLLGAYILYNNISAANLGFPMIREIALKCLEHSPGLFNDIVRSCLYMLAFHEVGHEYSDEFGVDCDVTAAEPCVGMKYRDLCYNPPHGPKYTVLVDDDGRERVYVPYSGWIEEFAADLFALKATLTCVAVESPSFADFEKTIHHLAIWQFVLWYLYVGNVFRDDPARTTHPSAQNRVDLMVFHLDPIGVKLFGDWRSGALTILQQRYIRLFSPAFAQAHRAMGERAIAVQPLVYIASGHVGKVHMPDKARVMPALRHMMEAVLVEKPLEAWAQPLRDLGSQVKHGHEEVLMSMAAVIKETGFRLEESE